MATFVAAAMVFVFLPTVPAAATAPTRAQLRAALLRQKQMPAWDRTIEPGGISHHTFCNKDRHVEWQTVAFGVFSKRYSSTSQEFRELLVGYSNAHWAHRGFREVKAASAACRQYSGGEFTTYQHRVASPKIGTEAFAVRTKLWNHVGLPWYCFEVVVRTRQVVHADGTCRFSSAPRRDRAMTLIRKAYRIAVGRLS